MQSAENRSAGPGQRHIAALSADQQVAAGAGNSRVVARPTDHRAMAASTALATKGFRKASGL
jgi:hypothetical protein